MPSSGLSSARAEASRKNGAKSRGPKTPEGKARSAQNALKHGLRAQKYVVLPDEDAAAFEALEAALMEELAPDGALQTVLAKRVVAASWRLERAERLEAELFAHETYDLFDTAPDLGLALIRDCNGARAFDTLLRYRGGTLAELWRALRTLKALQAERAAHQAAPAPRAQPKEPESRGNPGESDRPGGPADAGKGDLNPPPLGRRHGHSRRPDRHPARNQSNPKAAESQPNRRRHHPQTSPQRATAALRSWPARRLPPSAGPAGPE